MKVSQIDMDVFEDAPNDVWFDRHSIDNKHVCYSRLQRMVRLKLLEEKGFDGATKYRKRPVTETCSRCDWVGTEAEMKLIPDPSHSGIQVSNLVCPKCGCDSYYKLA
ncbi:hypothetical protein [Neptuniibacter sp. QD37_11]|uniref:hypothetical protein n=1 Tax=Neptuniibacter sp. QD37_11 TaxID=3398209 RepID=UPI0039F4BB3A